MQYGSYALWGKPTSPVDNKAGLPRKGENKLVIYGAVIWIQISL